MYSGIFFHGSCCCPQAEQDERLRIIEEKQSRAMLKNTLDPLLSRLTKVRLQGAEGVRVESTCSDKSKRQRSC